jgi:hypothetical protein
MTREQARVMSAFMFIEAFDLVHDDPALVERLEAQTNFVALGRIADLLDMPVERVEAIAEGIVDRGWMVEGEVA